MQEYAYPDQKVFIKTHKGYVTSKKKIGKYRQIIQNILRIIQDYAYPDQTSSFRGGLAPPALPLLYFNSTHTYSVGGSLALSALQVPVLPCNSRLTCSPEVA